MEREIVNLSPPPRTHHIHHSAHRLSWAPLLEERWMERKGWRERGWGGGDVAGGAQCRMIGSPRLGYRPSVNCKRIIKKDKLNQQVVVMIVGYVSNPSQLCIEWCSAEMERSIQPSGRAWPHKKLPWCCRWRCRRSVGVPETTAILLGPSLHTPPSSPLLTIARSLTQWDFIFKWKILLKQSLISCRKIY